MRYLAALAPALLGALLVSLAAAGSSSTAPQSAFPHRIILPAVAADSASAAPPPATPTSPPAPTATPTPAANAACGYRADVRALADPLAGEVDRDPVPRTIATLLALQRPPGLTAASPRQLDSEGRAVALTAWLRGAMRTPQNTIELLISTGPDAPLLRARLVSTACSQGASDADRAAMEAARIAFLNRCGVPSASQWTPLGGQVTLVGVPAWGEPRTSGVDGAPSGIELAPVLAFAMEPGAGCDPGQPFGPTPAPTPGPVLELLVRVDPYRYVPRGTLVTVTLIVQEPPPPGGTPRPGPAGIACRFDAYDHTGQRIGGGGPAPTGPGGTVTFTFTIPQDAAAGGPNQPGSVVPRCDGLATRGGARLEIIP